MPPSQSISGEQSTAAEDAADAAVASAKTAAAALALKDVSIDVAPASPVGAASEPRLAAAATKAGAAEPALPAVSMGRVLSVDSGKWPVYALAVLSAAVTGGAMPCFSIVFSRITSVYYVGSDADLSQKTLYYMGAFFGALVHHFDFAVGDTSIRHLSS